MVHQPDELAGAGEQPQARTVVQDSAGTARDPVPARRAAARTASRPRADRTVAPSRDRRIRGLLQSRRRVVAPARRLAGADQAGGAGALGAVEFSVPVTRA